MINLSGKKIFEVGKKIFVNLKTKSFKIWSGILVKNLNFIGQIFFISFLYIKDE